MSEETQELNDGTWSGLKKTIIGTVGTVVGGGGIWLSTILFGGGKDDAAPAPAAQPSIIINNSQQQQQQQAAPTKTVIIKETSPGVKKSEDKPKKPKADEAFQEKPLW